MYRILIVEDDDVIAASVAAHLEAWGMETARPRDLRRVLDEFLEWKPHLVLMNRYTYS